MQVKLKRRLEVAMKRLDEIEKSLRAGDRITGPATMLDMIETIKAQHEALKYISKVRDRRCQDDGCTCAFDTAAIQVGKTEADWSDNVDVTPKGES